MNPSSRHIGGILACWLASLLAAAPSASLAADAEATAGNVCTADLSFHQASSSFISIGLNCTTQTKPFANEPALGTSKVVRGHFQFVGTNTVAFIWDRNAGKLYLDLNRDLNLTNDAGGEFTSAIKGNYQVFNGIRLPIKTASGEQQVAGDISLYDYSNRPQGTFALRSFWQGKLDMQGQEWEAGLVESYFGGGENASHLLLRPWTKRDKPFGVFDGSLQTVPFTKKLFFNGHAYNIATTTTSAGSSKKLTFTEDRVTLGDAKITGKFVERLTLTGGPYAVLLDKPEAAVRLPVGTYSEVEVCVQNGDVSAREAQNRVRKQDKIAINEKTPTTLTVGGPLTNSVLVTRRGSTLTLSYSLVGAGGQSYTKTVEDRTKPPEFVAYNMGRKVASGKFEYG